MQTTVPDARIPIPGAFIFDPDAAPTDLSNLCMDCGQFGSVVTAVGAPSTCPDGDSCVEVELTTRPALLSEVFTADALELLGIAEFADQTFFDALGCSDGPGTALRRLSGTVPLPLLILCMLLCSTNLWPWG